MVNDTKYSDRHTVALGVRLRKMRNLTTLSQESLAADLRTTTCRISRTENGQQRAKVDFVRRWAEACGFAMIIEFKEKDDD